MPLHGEVSISLVCSAHSASGGRVAGSNPASPTKKIQSFEIGFFFALNQDIPVILVVMFSG